MADVGGISYSVDIETSGVMAAQKEATSATSAIGKSMDDMAKKSDQASTQMTRTASSVKSAMGGMKGAVGQLGYQVQDIAVQLSMGTNAMMVFGSRARKSRQYSALVALLSVLCWRLHQPLALRLLGP